MITFFSDNDDEEYSGLYGEEEIIHEINKTKQHRIGKNDEG